MKKFDLVSFLKFLKFLISYLLGLLTGTSF